MFQVIFMMKRKAGMTFDEFQSYYETNHTALGLRTWNQMGRFPKKYLRRYLHEPDAATAEGTPASAPEPRFDVATELWFDSREDFEGFMKSVPEAALRMIEEDELNFVDRSKSVMYFAEVRETDLIAKQQGSS